MRAREGRHHQGLVEEGGLDAFGGEPEEMRRLALALRARLLFHLQCGIRSYPRIALSERRVAAVEAEAGGVDSSARARKPEAARGARVSLEAVHAAVRACEGCSLAEYSFGRVVGVGKARARLLVVGDYALRQDGQTPPSPADATETASLPGPCFGMEEDALFWKMMRAIQLRPGDVYVTNALKCFMAPGQGAEPAFLDACREHLLREIAAVQPQLICAMGEHAAQVLLGRKEAVARLRGSVHPLQIGGGTMARHAVMVTYHPRFLLRVEEMKKAAWQDLQHMREVLRRRGRGGEGTGHTGASFLDKKEERDGRL